MGVIYAIANQKGGVAKTTTAVNLAASLNKRKQKVLLVDFDPQGNAASGLGIDTRSLDQSIYDAIIVDLPVEEVIHNSYRAGLDVIPSNTDLAAAEQELGQMEGRALRLKNVLEPIREKYDTIIIDSPPSLGLLTINALSAADRVLIPIQTEYYALEGISQLLDTIKAVQTTYNEGLKIGGIVLTMYDGRNRLAKQVASDVRETFKSYVFKTMIPRNVRLSEAPSYGQAIIDYDSLSRGAYAYNQLAKELVKRDEK